MLSKSGLPPPGSASGTASDFSLTSNGTAITPTNGSLSLSPARNIPFRITVYRPSNYLENGYVSIYSGVNGPDNQVTFANVGSVSTSTGSWFTSSNYDTKILTGTFTTSDIRAGDTKLYAVFYSESINARTTVSESITIASTNTPGPTPTPSPGPTLPSSSKRLVCIDYGNSVKLTSPFDVEDWQSRGRLIWEKSINGTDWEEVKVSRTSNTYTTPSIYDIIYYKVTHMTDAAFQGSRTFEIDFNVSTPAPGIAQYVTCGTPVTLVVDSPSKYSVGLSYNWNAPVGWSFNGQGNVLTNASNIVEITPPSGVSDGVYQVRVNSKGRCGQTSDAIISVKVDRTPTRTPQDASFSVTNYEGCQRVYGVVVEAVTQGSGYYQYAASTSNGYANFIISDQRGGFLTIPLDMRGPAYGVSGTVTIYGPCGASSTFTIDPQDIIGLEPGCTSDPGGETQTMQRTAYPSPANEYIALTPGTDNAILVNSKGKVVKELKGRERVDISELPEGLYYLKARQGLKTSSQRIQVIH